MGCAMYRAQRWEKVYFACALACVSGISQLSGQGLQ